MTVEEAIELRRSVRHYEDKPVEKEKISALLEAARLAPSASNRQEGRYVAVTDPDTRRSLVPAAANQSFVGEGGCVIACCADTDGHVMRCGQLSYPIDVAIAIDHMTLRAVELGLGTCWIGAFSEDGVREVLGIPEEIRVVELLVVGYPKDSSVKNKNRLDLEEIVHWDKW